MRGRANCCALLFLEGCMDFYIHRLQIFNFKDYKLTKRPGLKPKTDNWQYSPKKKMSRYFSEWLSFCIFTQLVMAVWTYECLEKEKVELKPIPRKLKLPTECLMECTRMTYIKKLQFQDQRNIRFTDCTQGDLGEYCWSTNLRCTVGESFEHAFVVLPVDITVLGQVEVKTTSPTATKLSQHSSPTTVAENCGLLYDVTNHFSTANMVCIHVGTQQHVHGDKLLRCLPYLVTFWQRGHTHMQSGG